MIPYKHLFFDLDNTLIDFRANAREAFQEIFIKLGHNPPPFDMDRFLIIFERYNDHFWTEYRKGRIEKDYLRNERFVMAFGEFGIRDSHLIQTFSQLYMTIAPQKTNLFDQVHETLGYLKNKYYLYLLTNGFGDVQLKKLENCGLQSYFRKLFIAEMVGYQKPDRRLFEYAVKSVHAHKNECLVTGDDPEADISGAKNAGIDQVFFNPYGKDIAFTPTYEISSIRELRTIL